MCLEDLPVVGTSGDKDGLAGDDFDLRNGLTVHPNDRLAEGDDIMDGRFASAIRDVLVFLKAKRHTGERTYIQGEI